MAKTSKPEAETQQAPETPETQQTPETAETQQAPETPETQQAPETAAAPEYNPWKDMRQVFVPKRSRTEQDTQEVGVNDRTYFVPKEVFVSVPAPVWEALNEMMDRQKIMEKDARASSGQREYALSH